MRNAYVRNPMIEHALEQMHCRVKHLCREVLRELHDRDELDAPQHVRLSYYGQPLAPNHIIRDIIGEVIEEGTIKDALRLLLLIDPWPHANWGHECWVVTFKLTNVNSDKDVWKTKRQFPPEERDQVQLVPYAVCDKEELTLFAELEADARGQRERPHYGDPIRRR